MNEQKILTEEQKERIKLKREIYECQEFLKETDYIIIKYNETQISTYVDLELKEKFQEVQPKRVKAREKIKELEKELKK